MTPTIDLRSLRLDGRPASRKWLDWLQGLFWFALWLLLMASISNRIDSVQAENEAALQRMEAGR
jgi:CHASE2 domain-containing sensor protein